MKCTIVVDNWVPIISERSFLAEHGFSLLIEHEGRKILFDTGYTQVVNHNLRSLYIHPVQIDTLVLSHGHHDHTGGLLPFLQVAKKQYPLYAHPGIFTPRYVVIDTVREYVGIPYTKEQLTGLGVEWRLGEHPQEIAPNLWFSGQIPRRTDYELGDQRLVTCSCDGYDSPDSFDDDIALFYASKDGLVVIAGCTHSGFVNMVQYGLQVTGAKRLAGWIGGTHLGPANKEQQDKTIRMMEELQPDFVMAGHCTGFMVMAELSRRLGKCFIPATVGTTIEC